MSSRRFTQVPSSPWAARYLPLRRLLYHTATPSAAGRGVELPLAVQAPRNSSPYPTATGRARSRGPPGSSSPADTGRAGLEPAPMVRATRQRDSLPDMNAAIGTTIAMNTHDAGGTMTNKKAFGDPGGLTTTSSP